MRYNNNERDRKAKASKEDDALWLSEQLALAPHATRASPLGKDTAGRTFWYFGKADPKRVWVEEKVKVRSETGGGGSGGGGAQERAWGWGFYFEAAQVTALLEHLTATGAHPSDVVSDDDGRSVKWPLTMTEDDL